MEIRQISSRKENIITFFLTLLQSSIILSLLSKSIKQTHQERYYLSFNIGFAFFIFFELLWFFLFYFLFSTKWRARNTFYSVMIIGVIAFFFGFSLEFFFMYLYISF